MVYGLGGVGKSQLVLHYISEYQRNYTGVFWIEAGSKETIERDYIQIYRILCRRQTDTDQTIVTIENAVPAVKQWFRVRKGRWLVVLDSADTIDNNQDKSYIDLEYFMPDAQGVHVIITTRCSAAKEITRLEAVEVKEMESWEATELFKRSAKIREVDASKAREIDEIVRELGSLALAITLAGSYVSVTPRLSSDLKRYLPEYCQRRKELLDRRPKQYIHRYSESVLRTWEASYESIEIYNPAAARLLSLLAFINFEDIFISLFIRNSANIFTGNSPHTANELQVPRLSERPWQSFLSGGQTWTIHQVESAFETLQNYSLIQWRPDQESYAMHKLVHAWGQDRLEVDQQQQLSFLALGLLQESTGDDQMNPADSLRLVPHVMANFRILSALHQPFGEFESSQLTAIDDQIRFLRARGRWAEAYEIRHFHNEQMSKTYGNEHRDTLASASNLAQILYFQGKYTDSVRIDREVLEIRKRVLGFEDVDTLTSENNLATVLCSQGKYKEAEQMIRQTLETARSVLGEEHSRTLASLGVLATVLDDQGKYKDADLMFRKALEIQERTLGREHPDTLKNMNNLVWSLVRQGLYEEAEEKSKHVVETCEKTLGRTYPVTLTALSRLASVWKGQNKFKEAEELNREIWKLREETSGIDHHDTMASANNLALVLHHQANYEEAEQIYRQTLALAEEILGGEHPDTTTARKNLISLLESQGKHQEAQRLKR